MSRTLSSTSQLSWVFKGPMGNCQLCYLRTDSSVKKVNLGLIAEVSAHCWLAPLTDPEVCTLFKEHIAQTPDFMARDENSEGVNQVFAVQA